MKLKLKDIVLKYEFKNNIVLRFNSELIEIEDSLGDIKFLFSLLDGSFNELEIKNIFQKKYHNNKAVEYLETLKDLSVLEYVYDNNFDDYHTVRWSRNFDFFNALAPFGVNKYEYQNKIFKARVCLLGCGGLGSHILYELSAIGIQNITIVDFDKIELSNLNRQILYKEVDIGKIKVNTAKERILEFSPKMNVNAIKTKLISTNNIRSIIKNHDLVICVADKPRDKIVNWLNIACIKEKVPFINGGLNLARASFYSVLPQKTGCVECWYNCIHSTQKQIIDTDIENEVDYQTPAPALSALVSVATGIMVVEAIKIITEICKPSLTNQLTVFEFLSSQTKVVEQWSYNPNCAVCGHKNVQ